MFRAEPVVTASHSIAHTSCARRGRCTGESRKPGGNALPAKPSGTYLNPVDLVAWPRRKAILTNKASPKLHYQVQPRLFRPAACVTAREGPAPSRPGDPLRRRAAPGQPGRPLNVETESPCPVTQGAPFIPPMARVAGYPQRGVGHVSTPRDAGGTQAGGALPAPWRARPSSLIV